MQHQQQNQQEQKQEHQQEPTNGLEEKKRFVPPMLTRRNSGLSKEERLLRERREMGMMPRERFSLAGFTVTNQIGRGFGGRVFLATHDKSQLIVAVKVVDKTNKRDPKAWERARFECSMMVALRGNLHVCKLFGTVETEQRLYMVMQFADGGDLRKYIQHKGRLCEAEALKFFRQLVETIDYMHKKGFIHRDIKPANLFLDREHNLVVGDFGFAAEWQVGNYLTTSCGTLHFAAPEVLFATPYIGPEVDVYSCGVVLYCMLMGKIPFDGTKPTEVLAKMGKGFQIASDLSREACHLLQRMLEINPCRRATFEEVMVHPWFLNLYDEKKAALNGEMPWVPVSLGRRMSRGNAAISPRSPRQILLFGC